MDAILLDTNVLVYAYDPRDHNKQEQAKLVLDRLATRERAAVSVQCLSEFFSVTTRRLPERLTEEQALASVERLARVCWVLDLTPAAVLDGCAGVVRHGLSIWDALIWAVARLNQVPLVLTEDAPHGTTLGGVRFMNPFDPTFDMQVLRY